MKALCVWEKGRAILTVTAGLSFPAWSLAAPQTFDYETKLKAPGPLAMSGNTVVAAGYVFVRTDRAWVKQAAVPTNFSSGVAIDTDTLVVLLNVYVRNGTTWNVQQELFGWEHRPSARIALPSVNGICGTVRSRLGNAAARIGGTPSWLKLIRRGNSFVGYESADGKGWSFVGSANDIAMPEMIFVGLAVTSHQQGTLCVATFDSLDFSSLVAIPYPPSGLKVAVYMNKFVLSWTDNSLDEQGFNIETSESKDFPYGGWRIATMRGRGGSTRSAYASPSRH